MYINPFVAGVVSTLLVEAAAFIAIAVYIVNNKKD